MAPTASITWWTPHAHRGAGAGHQDSAGRHIPPQTLSLSTTSLVFVCCYIYIAIFMIRKLGHGKDLEVRFSFYK